MTQLFSGMRRRRNSPAGSDGEAVLMQKLGLLREADVFQDLSEDQMLRVGEMTVMTRCPRGRTVYTPGQTGEALFIIKSGKVQIYRMSPDGKKLVVSTLGAGTLFGDMPFTGQRMLDSYAEATEESLLCVMSRHDIEALIEAHPSIGIRLIGTLAQRVEELEARLEESTLRDVSARVAATLLRVAEGAGPSVAVTHQQLADTIGTHRETVTRTLGELQDRGLISLLRGRITINDPDGLKGLASGHEGRRPAD